MVAPAACLFGRQQVSRLQRWIRNGCGVRAHSPLLPRVPEALLRWESGEEGRTTCWYIGMAVR